MAECSERISATRESRHAWDMIEDIAIEHDYADLSGAHLHYAHAGDGPLVVFLHGFPQCWYMYRHQLAHFGRCCLAVAPDLRGYNLSSKPTSIRDYGPWAAAEDICELAQSLGYERFALVGHDWGAATAWTFALHYPEMLDALVILATPHPATFELALRESPEQQRASQYLLALRRADGESLVAHDDFSILRGSLDHAFLSDADVEEYVRSWRRDGALAGMLRWYRNEGLGPCEGNTPSRGNYVPEVTPQTIGTPTLVIYPGEDAYTRPAAHEGLDRYVADLTFHTIDGATHWIAEERPELVNEQVHEFLAVCGYIEGDDHRSDLSPTA